MEKIGTPVSSDNSFLFDERSEIETLEVQTYERSKKWANRITVLSTVEDDETIALDEFEEMYNDEMYNEDRLGGSEDMAAETEKKTNEDYSYAMCLVEDIRPSNANGILAQINKRANMTGILDSELQRMLEATLPIVEAYKRNWREAGLERVCNTFDLTEIEDKVGGWLRCNNSLVIRNLSISPNNFENNRSDCDSSYSSDSLHSRYIRSSKQHLGVECCIETITTTIKSYSLIENNRKELHKKYAYLAQDDTMDVLNGRRHRPSSKIYQRSNDFCRVDKHRLCEKIRHVRRQHRKLNSSPYTTYSSSADEEDASDRERYPLKQPCCSRDLKHFRGKHILDLKSCEKKSAMRYEGRDRFLPYRRENECSCKNDYKLCTNARHLANSSSENWLVESLESSDEISEEEKKESTLSKKVKRPCPKLPHCQDMNMKVPKIEQSLPSVKKSSEEKTSMNKDAKKTNGKKAKPKTTTIKKMPPAKRELQSEDSFELRLQEAIELSKKQYKKEMEIQAKKITSSSSSNNLNHAVFVSIPTDTEEEEQSTDTKSMKKPAPKRETNVESEKRILKNGYESKAKAKTVKTESEKIVKKATTARNKKEVTIHKIDDQQQHDCALQKNIKKGMKSDVDPKCEKFSKSNHKLLNISSSSLKNVKNTIGQKRRVLTSIREKRSDSDSDSYESSIQHVPELYHPPTNHNQFSNISTGENTTFFDNAGKICNSTALGNNTATSRQLLTKSKHNKKAMGVNPIKQNKTAYEMKIKSENVAMDDDKSVAKSCSTADNNDCTLISSTTQSDIQQKQQKTVVSTANRKRNDRIILYAPQNRLLVSENSIKNGRVRITEDHLAKVIGEFKASKFMKYYPGPFEFKQSSTIYYKPPNAEEGNYSSGSDIEPSDLCGKYGHLYESKRKIEQ